MRSGSRFLLVACAVLAVVAGPATAAVRQPNIVLIVTDDQRWDTLGYMPSVQSELVAHGVSFENGFVTNPLCCPSRASIFTGAYSHTTGVYRNSAPLGGFSAFDDSSTVATWLDGAGYDTAFVGKYLNKYPGSYVPPGWNHWTAFTRIGYDTYGLNVDGVDLPVGERPYSTDFLAQEAVSFIQSTTSPFFLYFAPYAPHRPAAPAERHAGAFADLPRWRPPSYNERDVSDKPAWVRALRRFDSAESRSLDAFRRSQLRTLLAVDDAVAAIVQALSETGQLGKTLIVYTSDNGFLWGEHRWKRKTVPYEESIRVPLVVRYDELVGSARTESRPVLNIDLAPTFAAVAGAAAPGAEGGSIVPLLTGEDTRWRSRFLVEALDNRPPTYCALRTSRYAFVTYRTAERELYDLAVDPYELRNLAATSHGRKVVARLRRPLARLCDPPPPGLSRKLLCTRLGTPSSDTLVGTDAYDILCGRGAGDRLSAKGGSDYVFPGAGRDVVSGGGGHDHVLARDRARDRITCGRGVDSIRADMIDVVASDCERVRRR